MDRESVINHPDMEKVIREFGNWCEAMADECPVICLHALDLLNEQEKQIKELQDEVDEMAFQLYG